MFEANEAVIFAKEVYNDEYRIYAAGFRETLHKIRGNVVSHEMRDEQ